MKPDKPIVYNEFYLDAMTGGSPELPAPVTPEQHYLAHLAGMAVTLPQPIILRDKFLAKLCGMDVDIPTYIPGKFPRKFAYYAKVAGQDVEVPQPITREEMYWFDYVSGQPSEQEYTGAVPVTFTANGQPLLDYLISGNTVQNGTPTPDNPITPEGTGDLETSGTKAGQYKIPISSANTTTPVYLGEVETTRKIKKLVLMGNEVLSMRSTPEHSVQLAFSQNGLPAGAARQGLNTHFSSVSSASGLINNTIYCGTTAISIRIDSFNTVADFKAYLAAQYAASTPVTVWYVLATETTGIVNEPLMKIGDYADTLSHAQAGVSIPTANGSTTLDVETTVPPSEIYIKYRGEAVATLSSLPAEVSNPEETPEEVNPEETEETENGSENISLQHELEAVE